MNRRGFLLGAPALVLGCGMTRGFWTPKPSWTEIGSGPATLLRDDFQSGELIRVRGSDGFDGVYRIIGRSPGQQHAVDIERVDV